MFGRCKFTLIFPGGDSTCTTEKANTISSKKLKMKCLRADLLLTLLFLGAYLFTRGFFLTRLEVRARSECDDSPSALPTSRQTVSCWLPKTPFRRLVLLVIDGWRFDFASGPTAADGDSSSLGEELSESQLRMIRGHMPKLDRLLHNVNGGRHSAELYRFVADPPTVTMQRLKGLTSGSLPTFIDAGANFASSAVEEDNLVSQMAAAAAGSNASAGADPALIFLGDDTWTGLFPTQFTVSRPFPSFDVRDLHTVDDGVLRYLLPAMRCGAAGVQAVDDGTLTAESLFSETRACETDGSEKSNASDWRLLVGHFLGVDHVGHRFSSPAHPAMARKLAQMDETIHRVAAELADDSLLVVMGDHGMTSVGGNHGGASAEEVTAALFMYAKRPGLFLKPHLAASHAGTDDSVDGAPMLGKGIRSVAQTDIVPTLSLLLGLPIPYASLGAVLPDVNFAAPSTATATAAIDLQQRLAKQDNAVATDSLPPPADAHAARLAMADALAVAASAAAHHVNAHQLLRYLRTYNGVAGTFAAHEVDALADAVATGDASLEASLRGLAALARAAAASCHSASEARSAQASAAFDSAASSGGDDNRGGSVRHLRRNGMQQSYRESSLPAGASSAAAELLQGAIPSFEAFSAAAEKAMECSTAANSRPGLPAGNLTDMWSHDDFTAALRQLASAREQHRHILLRAAALCRALWTRFDEPSMVAGLAIMAAAILLSLWTVFDAEAHVRAKADASLLQHAAVPSADRHNSTTAASPTSPATASGSGSSGPTAVAAAPTAASATDSLSICSRRAYKLVAIAFIPPLCVATFIWPQSIAVGAVNLLQTAVGALRLLLLWVLPAAVPLLPSLLRLLEAASKFTASLAAAARSTLPVVWLGNTHGGSGDGKGSLDGAQPRPAVSLLQDCPREAWLAVGLVIAFFLWPSLPQQAQARAHAQTQAQVQVQVPRSISPAQEAGDKSDGKSARSEATLTRGLRNRRASHAATGDSAALRMSGETGAVEQQHREASQSQSPAVPVPPSKTAVTSASKQSHSQLPLPRSAGSAALGVATLLLLALRLDGLFTNSFIVAEASVAAHLLCAALLLSWAAACRAALVQLRQQEQGRDTRNAPVAQAAARRRAMAACAAATAMVVVCLVCTRATLQRDGWLWPFPPSDVLASTAATAGDGGVDVSAFAGAQGAAPVASPAAVSATPVPRVETGMGKSSIGWQMELPLQLPLHARGSESTGSVSSATEEEEEEEPPASGNGPALPRWLLLTVHLASPTLLLIVAAAVDVTLAAAFGATRSPSDSMSEIKAPSRRSWASLNYVMKRLLRASSICVVVVATVSQMLVACYWRAQQVPARTAVASPFDVFSLIGLLVTGSSGGSFQGDTVHAKAQQSQSHHSLLEYSLLLRLVLPRIVYAASCCGVLALVARSALQTHRRRRAACGGSVGGHGDYEDGESDKRLSSRMRLYLALLPSLSLLVGPGSPIVLAAMGLHAVCLAGLRALAAPGCLLSEGQAREAVMTSTSADNDDGVDTPVVNEVDTSQQRLNPGGHATPVGCCGGRACAAALALVTSPLACHSLCLSWSALHYYLATGHGNQFNSLHFAAPFVGFDAFSPLASTVLMILNTLAAHIVFFGLFGTGLMQSRSGLRRLRLKAVALAAVPADGHIKAGSPAVQRKARAPANQHANASVSDSETRAVPSADSYTAPALALVLPNALAFVCTATFCCIARRHLMVWAIFAPKFCFDAMHLAAATAAAVARRLSIA